MAPLILEGRLHLGGRPLLPAIRLVLETGRWTSLLGASGVGKTTLLRLIAGLDTGAEFEGRIHNPLPVALMAQDPSLLPWLSLRDNVTLGARLRGERPAPDRLEAILQRTGLAGLAARRPHELSGGQRQRAALARTLMEDRPLVLLDEPFSALDAAMRLEMQDLTAELLRGRSVLMVTHDPAEAARLSDHILLLSPEGLESAPAPASRGPRAPDDPATLACQAALLTRLLRRGRAPAATDADAGGAPADAAPSGADAASWAAQAATSNEAQATAPNATQAADRAPAAAAGPAACPRHAAALAATAEHPAEYPGGPPCR